MSSTPISQEDIRILDPRPEAVSFYSQTLSEKKYRRRNQGLVLALTPKLTTTVAENRDLTSSCLQVLNLRGKALEERLLNPVHNKDSRFHMPVELTRGSVMS